MAQAVLKDLQRAHIKAMIGAKAGTPEAANNLLKVLRVLLDYGVDIEMIAGNPALGIKRYRSLARAITLGPKPKSRNSRRRTRSAPRGWRSNCCSARPAPR